MVSSAAVAAMVAMVAGTTTPALASAGSSSETLAQPRVADLEGRPVRRVVLEKLPNLDPETDPDADPGASVELVPENASLAQNQIRAAAGALYRQATVDADIARLSRLGRFERIIAQVQENADGTLDLFYRVSEQPIIRDVQIVGNRRVSNADIAEAVVVGQLQGTPIDRDQLDRYARRIEELYRTRGYSGANVVWDADELSQNGVVLFRVTEGSRVRVTQVRFEGNASFSEGLLKREIRTRRSGILSRGPLDDEVLLDDVAAIRRYYQDRGYLDVEVDRLPPRISPNGREAIVTFLINEGPLYTLRSVQVFYPQQVRASFDSLAEALAARGPGEEVIAATPGRYAVYTAQPMSSAQIAGLMEIKSGDVYALDKLESSMTAIENAFGALGYQGVRDGSGRLRRRELRDPDDPRLVDLRLDIQPGERVLTGDVRVIGNDITKHNVIRRQISVRPERPLDPTEVRRSRRSLIASGLFAGRQPPDPEKLPRLSVLPEDPDFPGYRDVLVEVNETNTGAFSLGGVISSDGGLVGTFSYTQSNFDVFDTPDSVGELLAGRAFRGGGQTFSINLSPGTERQRYFLSLSEPRLNDTDYSGTVAGGFTTRDFNEFDEARFILRAGVGRRFGTRWRGSLLAASQWVELSEIEPTAATDLFDLEGQSQLTTVAFQLTRNTTDDRINPGRGAATTIGIERAGVLGGDFDYTKLSLDHTIFATLNEDFLGNKTTLKLSGEVGYVPEGQGSIPVFERFFRGGRNFRGFDFRAISPFGVRADNGQRSEDPVGGAWELFLGAEIKQPVFEDIVAVVFFVDSGTVTNDPGFEEYRVSIGTGLRLVTPLSPAPIAFDFGFPIVSEETDDERLFTFSVDIPF